MTQVAPDEVADSPREDADETPEEQPAGPARPWRRRLRSPHLLAVVAYLLTAGAVTERV